MRMRLTLLCGALFLLVLSCGRTNTEANKAIPGPAAPDATLSFKDVSLPGDDAAEGVARTEVDHVRKAISSHAAVVDPTDTAHRFIRTADLRFRVKDVVDAALAMEDITAAHHGWVEHTDLRTHEREATHTPVSADSTLITTHYDLTNEVLLRVPVSELDSTIRAIGRWAEVFDHRTIVARDVHLELLRNALAEQRASKQAGRLTEAIDAQGRRLKETTAAEEARTNAEERRDEAVLAALELQDRIAFATVNVHLYQRTLTRQELVANERPVEQFRPSLWSRMGHALRDGWRMLGTALVGLLRAWPLLLAGVIAFLIVRRIRS